MKILGICPEAWISSAALIENGRIIAAAPEERFNREKMSRKFPFLAIQYCLKEAQCGLEDIDYIAVGWNPGIHIQLYNFRFSDAARWRAEYLYSVPNHFMKLLKDKKVNYVEQSLMQKNHDCKIIYVTHHHAHAANAFFLSPFKEAAILTADGRGEDDTCLYATGKDNKIMDLQTMAIPHSIGLVYSSVTQFLGFRPHIDEWKVMALASYYPNENKYYKIFKQIVMPARDGKIEIDLRFFNYYLQDRSEYYTPSFENTFGKPRLSHEEITEKHKQIAAGLQRISEEALAYMLNWLYKKTKMENVAVSGGSFMNSVFNGKIKKLTPFKNVFISSCPDDSGVPMGAALYVYNHILSNTLRKEQTHNYYGPEFSNTDIAIALDKAKIKKVFTPNIAKYAANLISKGKIVGWFQGKMEFGQRALGNRSILADPRLKNMKDKLNIAIKYRESFRPFAPSILEEKKMEYFECDGNDSSPFMEKVFQIKKEKQKKIPAVTHVDGSGRIQTVDKKTNPLYYQLISEFEKITGVPIVLNTSFNLNGEPIVCTPNDAIRTFFSCGMDALVMGNYVLTKNIIKNKKSLFTKTMEKK
ncbi:MAG: Carbamoyl transferase [Parcubacteria group bacterium GW2011_GWA2_38_13]|nr:MAG: Carbamoyl transferase [Parcubacteria group bacterium GW2011_GWA2_38_13]